MGEVLPHWLDKQALLSPNKIAIELEDGSNITFSDLQNQSQTLARQLAGLGVHASTKVAVLSDNHLDFAILMHAFSYLQAVAVLLNTKLSNPELTSQLEDAEASLLITTQTLKQKKSLSFHEQITFSEINKLPVKDIKLADEIDLSTSFTMMFTSGTTGKPKMVVHTYGNHWWSANASTLNLGLQQDDKWLLTLPMYHVGGLSILMRSVITGMEIFLMEKYSPEVFFDALKNKRITIASIVTVMLKDLLDLLTFEPLPEKVRCLLLGGSSVPETLLKKVKEKELPLFQSYGMTETSSQIVTINADNALEKVGSSGKALFPAQLKIENKDENNVGEIVVKGPMVINRYMNHPQANKKEFKDGWFKTGDLGYMDKEGFLFVMERRSDLIISGGENIYPSEVENVLLEIEGVQEAAVVAKEDDKWGQVPVAFVVAHKKMTEAMILADLTSKLASFKLPKEINFMKKLPRNATNKIMRHKLQDFLN